MLTPILSLHDVNITDFLDVLDACKGNVFLVTHEGDKMNLKSTLCQLVGLTRLIEGGKITHAQVYCDNRDDERMLFRLNLLGNAETA